MGQHKLTLGFHKEQSHQRNAFPKQSFSSSREAALLLISLSGMCWVCQAANARGMSMGTMAAPRS